MSNEFCGTGNVADQPVLKKVLVGAEERQVAELRVYFDEYRQTANGEIEQAGGRNTAQRHQRRPDHPGIEPSRQRRARGGAAVARHQAAALEDKPHRHEPARAHNTATDREDDEIGELERAVPPQHPAAPQHAESERAPFERVDLISLHGKAPVAKPPGHH